MSTETCQSSGLKSSSGVITAKPAKLVGAILIQAAAAGTLILYDNATTNSGTVLLQINTTTNVSTNQQVFNLPVEAVNGIYAAVTGASAGFIVHFSPM